jgi:hypothetical protein
MLGANAHIQRRPIGLGSRAGLECLEHPSNRFAGGTF